MTKLKAEKQLKKALAALDTAIQNWYAVNAPENKEHYATTHFRNYPDDPDGDHVSEITLEPKHSSFVYYRSSKDNRG